jgi:hypothetical protein
MNRYNANINPEDENTAGAVIRVYEYVESQRTPMETVEAR